LKFSTSSRSILPGASTDGIFPPQFLSSPPPPPPPQHSQTRPPKAKHSPNKTLSPAPGPSFNSSSPQFEIGKTPPRHYSSIYNRQLTTRRRKPRRRGRRRRRREMNTSLGLHSRSVQARQRDTHTRREFLLGRDRRTDGRTDGRNLVGGATISRAQ
jgi:hypothetical protein